MRKLLTIVTVAVIGLFIWWAYVPQNYKDKANEILGLASRNDKAEINDFIKNLALPKDPIKKREALLKELQKNLESIQSLTTQNVSGATSSSVGAQKDSAAITQDAQILKMTEQSQKIIGELRKTNQDQSAGQEITSRLIDKVIPPSENKTQNCPIRDENAL